jgi:flagellum-specific peptidoglycan hydrolase FlgJ
MRKLIQLNLTLLQMLLNTFIQFLLKNSLKIACLTLIGFFLIKNDIKLEFQFNSDSDIIPNSAEQFSFAKTLGNFLDFDKTTVSSMVVKEETTTITPLTDHGNTYSNMTYHPTGRSAVSKKQRQIQYVQRFKDVARSEMRKYGIPASITLAQGLIESNAGESRLSRESNNHFGMKCFSKVCKKGHCSNFTDDTHKDFFVSYASAWESFRAHSRLLQGKRYQRLKDFRKDYKKWAHGLKKAGYATDQRYAEKLIHIIEELNLAQYDN